MANPAKKAGAPQFVNPLKSPQLLAEVELAQTILRAIRYIPVGTFPNLILDMAEIFLARIEQDRWEFEPIKELNRQVQQQKAQRAPLVQGAQFQLGGKAGAAAMAIRAGEFSVDLYNLFVTEFRPFVVQAAVIPQPFPNGPEAVVVWKSFRSYVYSRPDVNFGSDWTLSPMVDAKYDISPKVREMHLILTTAPGGWRPDIAIPGLQLDESIWAIRRPEGWLIWEPQWEAWLRGTR